MTIEVGTKVELLPGKDEVYERAVAGAQGFVLERKEEEGFPMVYIEWDKEHARYTGQEDCWTFESHFKPLVEFDFANLDSVKLFEQLAERSEDPEAAEQFAERLEEVYQMLLESEGFMVVLVRKDWDENRGKEVVLPYVYSAALKEEMMLLLEAQLVQIAAFTHQEMAMGILSRLSEEDKAEEDDDDDEGEPV